MFEYIEIKEEKMICPICKCVLGNWDKKCVNYCFNCGIRLFDKQYENLKVNKEIIGKKCYIIYGRKLIKSEILNESEKYYSVKVGNGMRNYLKEKVIFDNLNQ